MKGDTPKLVFTRYTKSGIFKEKERARKMIEKMNPLFIRIPNVLMYDTKIVPNAKYLYGILDMLSYYTESITNEELSIISQISHNSIEKYLKQLKERNYILIERTRTGRKITPLIERSIEIKRKKEKEQEINNKEKELQNEILKKKLEQGDKKQPPECVKEFFRNIK